MMKVAVTGAGALLGQGIIRALGRSGLDAHVVAVDPSPLSPGLYWADEARIVPMAADPGYLDAIDRLLAEVRPDALLVGTDVELGILAAHRDELERRHGTHVLVSSPEVVAIADDKFLTYEFLRDHGFPYPDTALPEAVDGLVERVGFPLVVKPRVGARSIGVHVVADRRRLEAVLADAGEGAVVQEHVSGPAHEFTAGVLCFDGECRASIVMRRDLRDGNTYRAFVGAYPELNAEVRRLAEALRPHGPANFQFRLDGTTAKVFEINGRFSGTTPLRAHAGFNEVELCLRHLLEGRPVEQPEVEEITVLRHWSETVVRPGELLDP